MEVDLLTNALVQDVVVVSNGAEPLSAKPLGGSQADSAAAIERGEIVTPDNNQADASSDLVNKKPSVDFFTTLEEKIQAQASQTSENPMPAEVMAMPGQLSPEQAQPVQSKESQDLAAEIGKVLAPTPAQPQQMVAVENSELLTNLPSTTVQQTATAKAETPAGLPNLQSSEQLIELTAQQAQMESQSGRPPQDMLDVTGNLQATQVPQTNTRSGANNEDTGLKPETAAVQESGQVLEESLEEGAKARLPIQMPESAADQNPQKVTNPERILKDNTDAGKEASSETQEGPAKNAPDNTPSVFADAQAKANVEEQNKTLTKVPESTQKTILGNEENGSTEHRPEEFNPAQVESVTSNSNAPKAAPVEAENSLELEQAVPANSPHIQAPEQLLIAQTPNAHHTPTPKDNAAAVSEQIRESITSSPIGPDREITIRLNPPELGTVVVKFQEQENQITGILEVSKSQTRAEIQQLLPEITRDLQNFGVPIRRIEVVMAAEQESETLSGQSGMPQNNNWAGWQGHQGSEPNGPGDVLGGGFQENIAYADAPDYGRPYVNDKSIDMFV